jgi:hypothetical protein
LYCYWRHKTQLAFPLQNYEVYYKKSHAMTTKKTTKAAPARKTPSANRKNAKKGTGDQDFPGYPKYSPEEDITRQAKRIDENLDDEVLTQVKNKKELKDSNNRLKTSNDGESGASEVSDGQRTDRDRTTFEVTNEDLEALGPKDLSMDMGDDEQLKHRTRPVDFSGKDLDVPGSELDDEQEEKGSEDEENNSYSLGGDGKENLDEGQEHERAL